MAYKYKEIKKKDGRPRNEVPKETLPPISIEPEMREEMLSSAKKLNMKLPEFRRMAYKMLIKYTKKLSSD